MIFDENRFTSGIKTFLSLWDDGYKILCDVKYNCFVKLIKYSSGSSYLFLSS